VQVFVALMRSVAVRMVVTERMRITPAPSPSAPMPAGRFHVSHVHRSLLASSQGGLSQIKNSSAPVFIRFGYAGCVKQSTRVGVTS
jgi:hypothetical protein